MKCGGMFVVDINPLSRSAQDGYLCSSDFKLCPYYPIGHHTLQSSCASFCVLIILKQC